MKFNLLHVCVLLSVALVRGHATLSSQVYWNSVLPNTPMPKAIKDLLYTKAWDDGKQNVTTNSGTSIYIKLKDHQQNPAWTRRPQNQLVTYWLFAEGTPYDEGKNPMAQLLFLENDLYQGKAMKLQFNIYNQKETFLPKDIADSMPILSKDIPEIYNMFSVKPDSMEAKTLKETLRSCDQYEHMEGEEKVCATSLESMIDFVTTNLGKKVKALSTENAKDSNVYQKYTIEGVKKLVANKAINCHRHKYPYALFYCHAISSTQAYVVSLEGADGTKVKAPAVCHTDTSKFNPNHMAFKVLKVAPGGVPVCHFLLEDAVLWVPY